MKIRDAGATDLDTLVALNNEVQAIHVSLFPDVFREIEADALRQRFEEQLADPLVTLLVAESDSQVVGYAVVRISTRDAHLFCHARSCGYVDQIGVATKSRHKGVGRALIEEAARRAREHGMSRLELDVWSENESAKSAFGSLGFRTYNEKMYIDI